MRREAEHRHTRFETGHSLCRACCAHCDLRQLVGVGHRRYGHVAHHQHTLVATFGGNGQQQHGAAYACDAGSGLDDLQSRTKHIACGVLCTGQLTVGIAGFDDEAAEIQRVLHEFARLLNGHALLFAEFAEQLCIFLLLRMIFRVDDGGFVNVAQAPFFGKFGDFFRISQDDEVGHAICEQLVGSFQGAFFRSFGQHDALFRGFGTCHKLFDEFHNAWLF